MQIIFSDSIGYMDDGLKLVCFDLNKTLIKENTWLNLNLAMGVTREEDNELMRQYDAGEITYEQSQQILSDLYRKRGKGKRELMLQAINTFEYIDGVKEVVAYVKQRGYQVVLLSGAMDLLVEKIAGELEIDFYAAHNILEFDSEGNFQHIICTGDDADFKLNQLSSFCQNAGLDITQAACVGDGDNDIKIFRSTHHGITFKGSKIEKDAWKTIDKLIDIKRIL